MSRFADDQPAASSAGRFQYYGKLAFGHVGIGAVQYSPEVRAFFKAKLDRALLNGVSQLWLARCTT